MNEMYKCEICGEIFDESECPAEPWSVWFDPFKPIPRVCPNCGHEYLEEAKECEICENLFLERELIGGTSCNKCFEKYYKDFDVCYNVAKKDQQEIKINGLLKSIFSVEEIEEILCDYVKSNMKDKDFRDYIDSDKDWFAENLIEEVKK